MRHVRRTLEWLEAEHPRYLWTDPATGLRFSHVPEDAVTRHYVPEQRLAEIVASPADSLERETRDLATLLARAGRTAPRALGVSGSILLGLHNPAFSDIDLLIYGADHARRLRAAIDDLAGEGLVPLPDERRAQWREETAARFGLDGRRWWPTSTPGAGTTGSSAGATSRSIRRGPTQRSARPTATGATRRSGARWWRRASPTPSEAMFLPAVYRVTDVRWLEGPPGPLEEIVAYEGLFGSAAEAGERVLAEGHLEAERAGGRRLVVGSGFLPDGGSLHVLPRGAVRPGR